MTFAEPFVAVKRKPRIQRALQEVVNDLYDGFLSKQDRKKLTKDGAIPPRDLIKPPNVELDAGPTVLLPSFTTRPRSVLFPTWLAQPPAVPVWVSLAHETCGHAILSAYSLERRLRNQVRREFGKREGKVWSAWFGEAASDCLAVLNLGPAMALGSVASWRAYNSLTRANRFARLPCVALERSGRHPPPVIRVYLMAHVTSLLRSRRAQRIGIALKRLIRAELKICRCSKRALRSAEEFARILTVAQHGALNDSSFLKLQNWDVEDDRIVGSLRRILRQEQLPGRFERGHFAGHALAAAILENVTTRPSGRAANRVLPNLIRLLELMYVSERGKRTRRELRLGN